MWCNYLEIKNFTINRDVDTLLLENMKDFSSMNPPKLLTNICDVFHQKRIARLLVEFFCTEKVKFEKKNSV